MRRIYVRPLFRRQGIGGRLALVLIERAFRNGELVTVNAGSDDAAAFWEALGFAPNLRDGYTHSLHRPRSWVSDELARQAWTSIKSRSRCDHTFGPGRSCHANP
jgi:GNAT superfamily N-acetyltransferase